MPSIVRGETQLSVIVLVWWCSYVGIKERKDQFCLCVMVCVVIFVQDRNKIKNDCVHAVVLCCHCWLGEKKTKCGCIVYQCCVVINGQRSINTNNLL